MFAVPLYAQVNVEGTVVDAATGEPLLGVHVRLAQPLFPERERVGVVTGADGTYSLMISSGTYILTASFVGYDLYQAELVINTQPIQHDIRLHEAVVEMQEVEVTDQRPASDVRVSVLQIAPQAVTGVAGVGDNVLRTLHTLPGVASTNDYSSLFIVRGGGPDQNLIFLDDIEIASPYQLNGFTSTFNPLLIRDIELYTGAFPARYGDRLSSVLTVSMREGSRESTLAGQANISTLATNLALEGKTGFWDGSWILGGRRTLFDALDGILIRSFDLTHRIDKPRFADVQGKLVLRPTPKHTISLTTLAGFDKLNFNLNAEEGQNLAEEETNADERFQTKAVGITWYYLPSVRTQYKGTASWYRSSGTSQFEGVLSPHSECKIQSRALSCPPPIFGANEAQIDFGQRFSFDKYTLAGDIYTQHDHHTLEMGGGLNILRNVLDLDLTLNDYAAQVFDALQEAPNWVGTLANDVTQDNTPYHAYAYAQDKLSLFRDRLFIQPGVRFDSYSVSRKGYFSPRINGSVAINPITTLRAGYGHYLQSPGYEKLVSETGTFDLARFAGLNDLTPEKSTHFVAGLDRWLDDRWRFKVEGYWKTFQDLVVQQVRQTEKLTGTFNPVQGSNLNYGDPRNWEIARQTVFETTPLPINDGEGHAYGLEILLEKQWLHATDHWTGWLSYAYAKATREQMVDDERVAFPFQYDQRHAFTVVATYRVNTHWEVGMTWRYRSGFPFTPPVGFDPIVFEIRDPETGAVSEQLFTEAETGFLRFVPNYGGPQNLNSDRLPPYHRLDLRVTYKRDIAELRWELFVDLINAYNRKNVSIYRHWVDYENQGAIPGQPPRFQAFVYSAPTHMLPFLASVGVRVSF